MSDALEASGEWSDEDVLRAVRSNALWYHTIELRPGIVTPGWFDLRPIVGRLPFPDVRGKRCLDVGTYDGHFAFLLERLGASEVVATDLPNDEDWDWPPAVREQGLKWLRYVGSDKGKGFEIAARALGSSVEKRNISVYDLSPESIGTFDVVVCGSLLLHLRDPLRALDSIRHVCSGQFLSFEEIDLSLTLQHRSRGLTRIGPLDLSQWQVPNLAGHRLMVSAAGFEVERTMKPYCIPFGVSHPRGAWSPRAALRRKMRQWVAGGDGVLHSALLARPLWPGGVPEASVDAGRARRAAVWEAVEAHRSSADHVLPSGDPSAIKHLYIELGERLESAASGDPEAIPVLSFPENAPVVAALVADVEGLILDAGCGPDPVVSMILGQNPKRKMVALDIGLGTIRLAREKARHAGIEVLPVVADVEALPFRDAVFDASVCEDTIEHLPDDRAGIEELARVLRRGGRAILATPNRVRLEVVRQRVHDRLEGIRRPAEAYYASNSHLREYTRKDLERLVAGRFRIARRASVGWTGGWRARLATRLVRFRPFRHLSRMVVFDLRPR